MSYSPPSIGPAGLTVASYSDILQDELNIFLQIYGSNQYVGNDSAIYQFISSICLKIADENSGLQLVYNQFSPLTAVGSGLDRVVKMNGIARLPNSFSTAQETITGTPGAIVTNGAVQDISGNLWTLPSSVTIPSTGSTVVIATCTVPGNITANVGAISIIATPQAGWTGANNAVPAVAGLPVEADSHLRARQSISVALPSRSPLVSTIAAIAATTGVTRYNVLENPTNATDSYGNPPHSITAVVEGGTELAVATAIYNNRTIGCFTNGTTTVPVTDPFTGYVMNISYDLPTYVPIYVAVTIHGLTYFTSSDVSLVQTAISGYINSLQIGEVLTVSALYAAAMAVTPSLSNPQFSIKSIHVGTSASGLFQTSINNAGTGYAVNDVLTVVQSGASGGTVTVTSIGTGGAITGLSQPATAPGTGYSVASGLSTTGGTGSGATVNILSLDPMTSNDITVLFNQVVSSQQSAVVSI